MRIVFMGASELGWECCRTMLEAGQQVVGMFSIPKEFRISWSARPVTNVRFKSFEDLAQRHGIPLEYVTTKMSDPRYQDLLRCWRPDLLVVIGWYYMVPRCLRDMARLGAVGIHASLLPRYRGGAPLVWAMINGERETGVSLFHFADGVDTGDVIAQRTIQIALEDDIAAVVQKSVTQSKELVREFIPRLAADNAPRWSQDHSQATLMPQRKPDDGLLDWKQLTALQAYHWIRAQTRPYPGAFTYLGAEKVILWKARLLPQANPVDAPPGSIAFLDADEAIILGVTCNDGRVLGIDEVELEDGRGMSGQELAHTRDCAPGALFGESAAACVSGTGTSHDV